MTNKHLDNRLIKKNKNKKTTVRANPNVPHSLRRIGAEYNN